MNHDQILDALYEKYPKRQRPERYSVYPEDLRIYLPLDVAPEAAVRVVDVLVAERVVKVTHVYDFAIHRETKRLELRVSLKRWGVPVTTTAHAFRILTRMFGDRFVEAETEDEDEAEEMPVRRRTRMLGGTYTWFGGMHIITRASGLLVAYPDCPPLSLNFNASFWERQGLLKCGLWCADNDIESYVFSKLRLTPADLDGLIGREMRVYCQLNVDSYDVHENTTVDDLAASMHRRRPRATVRAWCTRWYVNATASGITVEFVYSSAPPEADQNPNASTLC